jgi:hypothetical protein
MSSPVKHPQKGFHIAIRMANTQPDASLMSRLKNKNSKIEQNHARLNYAYKSAAV